MRSSSRASSPLATQLALSGAMLLGAACGGTTASTDANDASADVTSEATLDTGASFDAGPDTACLGCPPPPIDGGSINPNIPPDPGGPPPDGTGSIVLAFSHLYIGDTDRQSVASSSAWKQYGLDIDHKTTDRTSTDVCTLASGASKASQVDGVGGIDNAWGNSILPIILTTAGSDASARLNDAIARGDFTRMIRLDKVGSLPSYSPLPGLMYAGTKTASPPTWNGNDMWPVDVTSLNGGNVDTPKVVFTGGYMNARTWVGAPPTGDITLPLVFGGVDWPITLAHAQITMRVAADGRSASEGVVSGAIATEEYILALKQVAGRISTSLCNGSAFESIAQQIRQAADIMLTGANAPGVACDAISLGWGFDAKLVKLGAVQTPPPPPPDPCAPPDAGAD
jgi:hypothetical protein